MKNIKIFGAAIFIIMLLVQAGCSEDPVAPTDKKPIEALAVETIGPEGGEIVADEFTLTIPASSFNTSAEIKIFASSTDKPFGENHVSKLYKIEGLPQDYTKPLKLSVKYSNVTSSGSNILVLGEESLNHGTFMNGYRFLESIDSSGYTISHIPPYAGNQNSLSKITELNNYDHFISVINGYGTWDSENGNFIIHYPINSPVQNAVQLGSYLEDAYEIYLNLGFSYEEREYWPIDVILRSFLDKKLDGVAYRSKWGDESNWLEFGLDNIEENRRRVTAGHEFFHFVQSLYDSRKISLRWASIKPNHYWFDEATAAWAEEKFSNSANYTPEVRDGNHLAPFEGMQKYPSNNPWNKTDEAVMGHGYGMSAVVKYLVSKRGENILIKIYEDLKKGEDVVDAIFKTGVEDWWEDFLQEYILGNVYDDFTLSDLNSLDDLGGRFVIKSKTDTEIIFTKQYQDLSARAFQIRSMYSELNPESKISFKISGASKRYLTLFKYGKFNNEEKIEFVNSDSNEIVIEKIKALIDDGWNFYAIVSNGKYSEPYTDQHEITLEIKVEEKSQNVLDFNRCSFGLSFNGIIKETTPNGTSEDERSLDWNWYIYSASGSFSGNTFTGGFNERSGEFVGTITATLNDEHTMITNFEWTFEYRPNETTVANYFVTGKDLPSKLLDPSDYRFGLSFDSNVCSHLLNVKYKYTDVGSSPVTEELLDHSCDEYSRIGISFKKE